MQKYRIVGKKGEGTFSEVLKCQNMENGQYYACKRLKQQYFSLDQINNLREIQCMRRLSPHINIVQLKEVIFDKKSGTLALIIELQEMNLYEMIKGRKTFLAESKCRLYIYQVLKAVDHMHRNGIFHRDIKPENILLKKDVIKLADFGSCRSLYSKQPYTEYISTRWYRSPECLLTDGWYSYKMDIWSVGCVFAEVISLQPLFPGTNELDQITRIHKVFGTPSEKLLSKFKKSKHMDFNFLPTKGCTLSVQVDMSLSEGALQVIEALCRYDPDDRPSAKQVLRHVYFKPIRDSDKRHRVLQKVEHLAHAYKHYPLTNRNNKTKILNKATPTATLPLASNLAVAPIVKKTIQLPDIAFPKLSVPTYTPRPVKKKIHGTVLPSLTKANKIQPRVNQKKKSTDNKYPAFCAKELVRNNFR